MNANRKKLYFLNMKVYHGNTFSRKLVGTVYGINKIINMYGTHIQATKRYYNTQAMIKKNELEKVTMTLSYL